MVLVPVSASPIIANQNLLISVQNNSTSPPGLSVIENITFDNGQVSSFTAPNLQKNETYLFEWSAINYAVMTIRNYNTFFLIQSSSGQKILSSYRVLPVNFAGIFGSFDFNYYANFSFAKSAYFKVLLYFVPFNSTPSPQNMEASFSVYPAGSSGPVHIPNYIYLYIALGVLLMSLCVLVYSILHAKDIRKNALRYRKTKSSSTRRKR